MGILVNVILVLFSIDALLMVLVILMQRPKSEGLGAAFGGGVTENIFGAQTTNVLTKITGWLAGVFFALCFLLSILYAHHSAPSSGLRQELMKTEPGTAALPAASASPGLAVGPPNTVTNPTPGGDQPAVDQAQPLTPADQAVGMSAPVAPPAPVESPAGSPATSPKR
ncbi:MAG: preprotein translocase subunit SecG [Verrucomicrobiota bacterium]|nr:preprotein translocase subunit SecG [Verrucomicrobiota bacterium]